MSDNVLIKICADKRAEVAARKALLALPELRALAIDQAPTRGFARALDKAVVAHGYGLIAEIKKASPSAGLIRPDFDPVALARAYEEGGAACLSILTDEPYFSGSDAFLIAARKAVALPALRKDFVVDVWQIWESRMLGADCVLLILSVLSDDQAQEMEGIARELGMDVLIEVHDEAEFARALRLNSPLIGVNNRDLKAMKTDIATTERLAGLLPKDRCLISESGLKSPLDLARMARCGARRFLIGESLMRQDDVAKATHALLADPWRG